MAMMRSGQVLAKALYAAMFVLVLPVLLIGWAIATADVVRLPLLPHPWAGWIVAVAGLFLMLAGAAALWRYGGGLPMSPYPPPVYVMRGVYRFLPHPIYVGFVLLCLGAAMLAESASGIWLVTPSVALAAAALVLGYERHDLRRRFGPQDLPKPLIALPADSMAPPSGWDRLAVFVLVFLPWSVAFEAVYRLGVPPDAVAAYLPFEREWPVLEWTEAVYGSVYLFVLGSLFVARTRAALRRMAVTGLIATAFVTVVYLTVPLVAPPRPFEAQSLLGHALLFERAMSHTVAAFPAFHVIWSCIAAAAWATRSRRVAVIAWTWATLIAISCLTTGMHAIADILAAVATFLLVRRYRGIWDLLRRLAERVANSWREWRWDGVRVISHAGWAALAGTVGFAAAAAAGGSAVFEQLLFVYFAGLLGAGLWAQTLEGSSKLSRPFGYYGGALGSIGGAVIAGAVGGNTMLLLGSMALAAPWMQGIGRARCLVQGCCHGSTAPEAIGIRYWHERSRVCHLGGLRGVPLHPTPLYSMLANAVVGVLLLRLWALGASLALVAGAYLMLGGAARFVEESYRGEPQTPIVAGLRIYQWLAIVSFIAGAALTTVPSGAAPGPAVWLDARVLLGAVAFGAAAGFAMGVDFPRATGRFTRLAPP